TDEAPVLDHAAAIAAALGQPLTIARVIDPPSADTPADPVDWHLRGLELRAELERIKASPPARLPLDIRADVLEGGSAWQIRRWATELALDLLVLSRNDHAFASLLLPQRTSDDGLSLLIVPGGRRVKGTTPPYARILVPLDGSARAESALPIAMRLAQTCKAELLLV